MTPDTGLVDLIAEETDQSIRALVRYQASAELKTDQTHAAFLVVTGVWASGSLIDSPVLYTKDDGTQVTDYPRSLAVWAGTTDEARTGDTSEQAAYWDAVRQSARRAQYSFLSNTKVLSDQDDATIRESTYPSVGIAARFSSPCAAQARYGAAAGMVRMNREYTEAILKSIVPSVFDAGEQNVSSNCAI
ncbi:unnamed protein product [Sphacelaria rigidula]